ncbi:MAG: hypothetical protein WC027_03005 [Candidatus Paceibacterota bacterium]
MIEITTAVAFLVSSLYGAADVAIAQEVNDSLNTQSQTAIVNPVTLEDYVQEYFRETPILAKVAKCESRYRQFGLDGQVLRGEVNSADVGLMQINEHYHDDEAIEMGLDLKTVDGNLAYAKHLYESEGTKPWNASKKCWNR